MENTKIKWSIAEVFGVVSAAFVTLVLIVASIWMIRDNQHEKAIDKQTAFTVQGTIQEVRKVFKPEGLLGSTVGTYYMKINGEEYEVSNGIWNVLDDEKLGEGDYIKVTGKRGVIEGLEVVR